MRDYLYLDLILEFAPTVAWVLLALLHQAIVNDQRYRKR